MTDPQSPRIGIFVAKDPNGRPGIALDSNVGPHETIHLLTEAIRAVAAQLVPKEAPRITPASRLPELGKN